METMVKHFFSCLRPWKCFSLLFRVVYRSWGEKLERIFTVFLNHQNTELCSLNKTVNWDFNSIESISQFIWLETNLDHTLCKTLNKFTNVCVVHFDPDWHTQASKSNTTNTLLSSLTHWTHTCDWRTARHWASSTFLKIDLSRKSFLSKETLHQWPGLSISQYSTCQEMHFSNSEKAVT